MHRSQLTIDLQAVRQNTRTLLRALRGSELWAVVKANAYGHGAVEIARTTLEAGATALCAATVEEGLELRRALPAARILVLGPSLPRGVAEARNARLELVVSSERIPEGLPVHVKLDTGMGRWGLSELRTVTANVVGLMTHLATADCDLDFARIQVERFREATAEYAHLTRHVANSAAVLRLREAHFDAARCGIALYGLSPFGTDARNDRLAPVLSWKSYLAAVRRLRPRDSTGYGRVFVAERETCIGIVPVGYADGFLRDFVGTLVAVAGKLCPVVGTISMDAFAVELGREIPVGSEVILIGPNVSVEAHARIANVVNYAIVCGIQSRPTRTKKIVLGAT